AGGLDGGNFGIEDLQKTLNMWYPRGLEMFGSELGGDLVKGVFKTLKNREAQVIYIEEVLGKVKDANLAIIQAKARCSRDEADAALRRITQKGETVHGLTQDDLLFLPDRRFFSIRGLAEFGDYRNPGSDAAGGGYVYLPFALLVVSLPVSLWLYSRGVISGSDAFGIIVLGAGLVSLLVWASLISRIRFTRR